MFSHALQSQSEGFDATACKEVRQQEVYKDRIGDLLFKLEQNGSDEGWREVVMAIKSKILSYTPMIAY